MAWVRFSSDFEWRPTPAVTQVHKAPFAIRVRLACARAAEAAGAGVRMPTPNRAERAALEAEYSADAPPLAEAADGAGG